MQNNFLINNYIFQFTYIFSKSRKTKISDKGYDD